MQTINEVLIDCLQPLNSDEEDPTKFDKWIKALKMACYQSGKNI